MRRTPAAGLAAGLVALAGLAWAPPASAACVAADVRVVAEQVTPGSTVTVTGRGWRSRCDDTVTQTEGQSPSPQPPVEPSRVTLTFTQDGRTSELTTFVADADYAFTVQVDVPASADSGPATVTASGSSQVATDDVTVVAAGGTPGQELPRTGGGGDVAPLAATAATLLVLGAGLAWTGRRSRGSAAPAQPSSPWSGPR